MSSLILLPCTGDGTRGFENARQVPLALSTVPEWYGTSIPVYGNRTAEAAM